MRRTAVARDGTVALSARQSVQSAHHQPQEIHSKLR